MTWGGCWRIWRTVDDGASTISEIAVLADQQVVFGAVASWNWGTWASSQVVRVPVSNGPGSSPAASLDGLTTCES
jgi:hypothetical protein